MRKGIKRTLFTVVVVMLFGLSEAYATMEITLGYGDQDNPPYSFGAGYSNPDLPGIYIELMNQVADDLNISIKYVRLPMKRLKAHLSSGKIDGGFDLSFKQKRLKIGQYPMKDGRVDSSRRLNALSYSLYKLQSAKIHWDGKTFSNLSAPLGANSTYSIVDNLRDMGISVDETEKTESNLKKLQNGRISGYVTLESEADLLVQSGGYENIVKVTPPIVTKDLFLMFSHQFMNKHGDLADKFWIKLSENRDEQIKILLPKYQK